MSKEKQIEELTNELVFTSNYGTYNAVANYLVNKGYRKQSEAKWVDNHCTACGMTPIGEETWTRHGETPPNFEYCMNFCPTCGAKMKGGAE